MALQRLVFLKLGGSLITDKARPATPRINVLKRLAGEIAQAIQNQPDLSLILGHGSGSFGHVTAKEYGTRQGVQTPGQWQGFVEVWRHANALNRLVMDALAGAGLGALAISPVSTVIANHGCVHSWEIAPLEAVQLTATLSV